VNVHGEKFRDAEDRLYIPLEDSFTVPLEYDNGLRHRGFTTEYIGVLEPSSKRHEN